MSIAFGDARLPDRFWSKVRRVAGNECWLWIAAKNSYGYGQYWFEGRQVQAHRISRAILVGDCAVASTSRKLDLIDHLCRTRNCVNPRHLEPVTAHENTLRGEGITAMQARQLVCPQCGGEYNIRKNGWRQCNHCIAQWRIRDANTRALHAVVGVCER